MIKNITKLKYFLNDLESGNAKKVKEAAYKISSTLIALEQEGKVLKSQLLKIKDLALDLEIPKEHIKQYDTKLHKLIELIKSLGETKL